MPAGGTVMIETRNVALEGDAAAAISAAPGRYVVLRVSDTGVGMDAETQRRIFEPFFTTKGPGKGTGLGLYLARNVVEREGGEMVIDSTEGRGTTVTLRVPEAD